MGRGGARKASKDARECSVSRYACWSSMPPGHACWPNPTDDRQEDLGSCVLCAASAGGQNFLESFANLSKRDLAPCKPRPKSQVCHPHDRSRRQTHPASRTCAAMLQSPPAIRCEYLDSATWRSRMIPTDAEGLGRCLLDASAVGTWPLPTGRDAPNFLARPHAPPSPSATPSAWVRCESPMRAAFLRRRGQSPIPYGLSTRRHAPARDVAPCGAGDHWVVSTLPPRPTLSSPRTYQSARKPAIPPS